MSAADATQRRSGSGREKVYQDNTNIDSGKNNAEGKNADDEERLYHCAECGKSAELGAIDEEDGQWYCKGCWEALLADEDGSGAADGSASPRAGGQGDGYHGPVDEDAEGVGLVLSDSCGSGFHLSQEGMGLLRARGKDYAGDSEGKDVPRMDPDLVALVRESASRMSGDGTSLVVRRVPREAYDADAYRIHNLDGKEFIAIDTDAYCEQARKLSKLLAAMHLVLYQGDQKDEERLRRLRKLAPAEALQASARPGEALTALAETADIVTGGAGGSGS
mmetsp:Transcript_59490/g.184568  ORF Transcript_59490/g.184568 Transcript_59490/m.184568 type:complete len:277 (-) Transcript_59490:131-961(-)